MGGLALLLATSIQAQYVRSGPSSGPGMRSRDRSALSGSLIGKRQEMRPGAGEAEQAAAGGDQASAETAGTGGEGDTGGDDAAPEVSLPSHDYT